MISALNFHDSVPPLTNLLSRRTLFHSFKFGVTFVSVEGLRLEVLVRFINNMQHLHPIGNASNTKFPNHGIRSQRSNDNEDRQVFPAFRMSKLLFLILLEILGELNHDRNI